MSDKTPDWQQASAALRDADSVLIVTHLNPDGDAIGSALGLANAIRHMGKTVTVADDDGVPDYLQWLPHSTTVVTEIDAETSFDLCISTDASDAERTGKVGAIGQANSTTVINLDHHATNTYFGDVHLVDAGAVAATEIVFDWWEYMAIDWQAEIAVPLLTGLVTDTIGFRTSSVTSRTLGIAQSLMEYGASLTEITARVLDSRSYQEMALWKRIMATMALDGQVIHAEARLEDMEAVNMDAPSTAGFVGFLRSTKEAMIAVTFMETGDGEIRISMRAKPGYDVSEVAFALGGGGHVQAAGAGVAGTLEDVKAKVLPMLQEAARKGKLTIV
jgi:bifunctional oligoribonuclease and PAP phosphatase NrnA